jgi:cyclic pyranopterin phosphate synthase
LIAVDEESLVKTVAEKESRRNLLNIRIDKTVPEKVRISKRVCNENCIFDADTDGKCHDDVFQLGDRAALSNSEFVGLVEKLTRIAGKKALVHIAGDGEPTLLDEELVDFVRKLKASGSVKSVKITTNGTRLAYGKKPLAYRLKEAGLDGLNISLHSLRKEEFKKVTGIDALELVMKGLDAAIAAGLAVSINCVVRKETFEEIYDYVDLSSKKGIRIKMFSMLSFSKDTQRYYDSLLDEMIGKLNSVASHKVPYSYPYGGQIFSVGGGVIEVKDSRNNTCPNLSCKVREICTEGCRYHARITRNGLLQPCGVRTDNIVDMLSPSITDVAVKGALASGGKY